MSGAFFVFIAFIVLANLLRLAGKAGGVGKGTGLPPRPGPRRYRPGDPRRLPGGRGPDETSAATMVPEELWRILMGEAPPAPRPAPGRAPGRLDDEVAEDVEAEIAEGRSADEAVSLEDVGGGAAAAGAAAATAAPEVRVAVAPAEAPRAPAPRSRARELRRAIVLREVLGPPRGLE
ncbi:MAG TPA: hypothetical protein VFQ38_00770 [Longimicrobiales bacterium]|nr:hypothetical protein [Longimicrobiales bacterium]